MIFAFILLAVIIFVLVFSITEKKSLNRHFKNLNYKSKR